MIIAFLKSAEFSAVGGPDVVNNYHSKPFSFKNPWTTVVYCKEFTHSPRTLDQGVYLPEFRLVPPIFQHYIFDMCFLIYQRTYSSNICFCCNLFWMKLCISPDLLDYNNNAAVNVSWMYWKFSCVTVKV